MIRIIIIQAVGVTADTVGKLQTGIEPLGGIGRPCLGKQQVNQLIIQNLPLLLLIDQSFVLQCTDPEGNHAIRHFPHASFVTHFVGNACLPEVIHGYDVTGILGIPDRKLQILHVTYGLVSFIIHDPDINGLPFKKVINGLVRVFLQYPGKPSHHQIVYRLQVRVLLLCIAAIASHILPCIFSVRFRISAGRVPNTRQTASFQKPVSMFFGKLSAKPDPFRQQFPFIYIM